VLDDAPTGGRLRSPGVGIVLTVQLLPAISKIIMLVRSKNLGMAAPMLPIRSRRYCAGRVIYGHSYRYPQPNFTFVSRNYFAAIRHASSLVSIFAVERRPDSSSQ
jgi:hypothetical protein